MKTVFSIEQFESAYPDGIENHWWYMARSRIVANAIRAFAGSGSSVLEVGCGRGVVVQSLRKEGIDCYGVELAKVSPVKTIEKYIHVGTDAIDLPVAERQRYDTILLLDVIEHISDPVNFLQDLCKVFPNLSCIVTTVPARPELWSNYDRTYGHHRRYMLEDLEKLSSQLCWHINRESYFFHLVYLPAWIMMKLNKNRKTIFFAPHGFFRLAHRLFSYFMLADYYLFPGWLPGTSIVGCFSLKEEKVIKNPLSD